MESGAEFPRCRKGGFWQEPSIWPLCVEPPRCDPSIGPSMPVSVNNSGLVGTYAELLEGEFTEFRCNDSIRAISGGNLEMIFDEPTDTSSGEAETSDGATDGATDTGGTDTSGTDTSGTDTTGTDTSETDSSGTDTSGTDDSGTDTSGTDTSGTQKRRKRNTSGPRKFFKVTCGSSGNWEAPYDEDWPTCELLPDKHCSVAQDLNNTIPEGFKLKNEAVTQVLNGETLMFVCSETSSPHAAVMTDGSRVTEFGLTCSDSGEFDAVWPVKCEPFLVNT